MEEDAEDPQHTGTDAGGSKNEDHQLDSSVDSKSGENIEDSGELPEEDNDKDASSNHAHADEDEDEDETQDQGNGSEKKQKRVIEDSDSSDDEPIDTKTKTKKKSKIDGSSFIDQEAERETEDEDDEDEEEDDDDADELKDLIDDAEENGDRVREKKRHRIEEDEKELADEDLALIEENLGVSFKKKKIRRLKGAADLSDGSDDDAPKEERARQPLSAAFDDANARSSASQARNIDLMPSGDESEDNFIVDDEFDGQDKSKKPKRAKRRQLTEAEEEARAIFGTFDLSQILLDEEMDVEDYDELESSSRPKKAAVHDPRKLEANYLTERDTVIKQTDCPERIQYQFGNFLDRKVPTKAECKVEAKWILEHGYKGPLFASMDDPILNKLHSVSDYRERKPETLLRSIERTVQLLRWEEGDSRPEDSGNFAVDNISGPREVPFIAQYRKDYVGFPDVINIHDLWFIKHWDEEYHKLNQRKKNLRTILLKIQNYQRKLSADIASAVSNIYKSDPTCSAFDLRENIVKGVLGCARLAENNPQHLEWQLKQAMSKYTLSPIAQTDGSGDGENSLEQDQSSQDVDNDVNRTPMITDTASHVNTNDESISDVPMVSESVESTEKKSDSQVDFVPDIQIKSQNPTEDDSALQDEPSKTSSGDSAADTSNPHVQLDLTDQPVEAPVDAADEPVSPNDPTEESTGVDDSLNLSATADEQLEDVNVKEASNSDELDEPMQASSSEPKIDTDKTPDAPKEPATPPEEPPQSIDEVAASSEFSAPSSMIQTHFGAIERVQADRTVEDSLTRLVRKSDIDMLEAASTDEDLNVIKDYVMLHFGDVAVDVQVSEAQLLAWCGRLLSRKLTDFHRSWHDGEAFLHLAQYAATEADRAAGNSGEYQEEFQERSPIAKFEKGISLCRHKLGLELEVDPIDLLKCKNRHCMLLPDGVRDIELENGSFVRLCSVCRPNEHHIKATVQQIHDRLCELTSNGKNPHEGAAAVTVKRAIKKDHYSLCRRSGLLRMVEHFGLTVEEFSENIMIGFTQYQPRRAPADPLGVAIDYVTRVFHTPERVLDMSKFCLAMQIARDPPVFQAMRKIYNDNVVLTVRPTASGVRSIDDWHPYARYRYLTDIELNRLRNDDYAWILAGTKANLLTAKLSIDMGVFWPELENAAGVDRMDDSDDILMLWNDARKEILRIAMTHMLPKLENAVRTRLKEEAHRYVREQCANHLRSKINRTPFQSDQATNEDDTVMGTKVCAIVVGNLQMKTPTEIALLHPTGDIADFLRLDFLTVRENARNVVDLQRRQRDWDELQRFLADHLPQLIVVGAERMDCQQFFRSVEALAAFPDDDDISPISVEYGDMRLSEIYAASKRSLSEFPDYSVRLRQAVSLGRMFQNSELEFAACFNDDNEILAYNWHPLQDQLAVPDLLQTLSEELITTINRAGVDLNQALMYKHHACALPFVCSFGVRKAASLIDKIEIEGRGRVYSRKHFCSYSDAIGAAVAWVSCGFFYMDPGEMGDDLDPDELNLLDTTRIHPEMYIYAGTIARDALEHVPTEADEKEGKSENIAQFLDDIREVMSNSSEKPAQLDALMIKDGARDGERRTGKWLLRTLEDIQKELAQPFKDTRLEYQKMSDVQLFGCFTQETVSLPFTKSLSNRDSIPQPDLYEHRGSVGAAPEQFFREHVEPAPSLMVNQIVLCRITRLAYRANDENPEAPPVSVGANVALQDSPLRGFIHLRDLTTSRDVTDAAERVQPDMEIMARVRDIVVDRFNISLGCKSTIMAGASDAGRDWDFTPLGWGWHPDYDMVASREAQAQQDAKQVAKQGKYQRRAIDHPAFKEVTFGQAEAYLKSMSQGEAIVRPSSKGLDHLTVSFNLTDTAIVHLDVREEDKNENEPSKIGDTLFIRDEQFESLDEILDSYVASITAYARQLSRHKNYREAPGGPAEQKEAVTQLLAKERKANTKRIPYCMWYRKKEPQSFMLSCYTSRAYHEFVYVKSDGFSFCGEKFSSLVDLLSWFKKNYINYTRQRSLRSAPSRPPPSNPNYPDSSAYGQYNNSGGRRYPSYPPPGYGDRRMMAR